SGRVHDRRPARGVTGPCSCSDGECADLRELCAVRLEVEAAAVAGVRRSAVGRACLAATRVLYELLTHHPPRGVCREAEPLPDLDAGLERVALGRPFVGHTAKVPRLGGEDGDRGGGLAPPPRPLEQKPIELEAAHRRQVSEVAPDGGDTVRVLDGTDIVAGFVTPDRDRLHRDAGGLLREACRRLGACARIEPVPAGAVLGDPEENCKRADETEAGDKTEYLALRTGRPRWSRFRLRALARLGDQRAKLLARLARIGDPQLLALLADEHQLLRLGSVAISLAVGGVRPAVRPTLRA